MTPLEDFASAGMPAEVMKYVTVRGWKEPTLIQSHCWPVLNAGRDVIGIAETGSGKTLGFSLPAMSKIFEKTKVIIYGTILLGNIASLEADYLDVPPHSRNRFQKLGGILSRL